MHYARAWRRGILDESYPKPIVSPHCKADGCDRARRSRGYCHSHYLHYEYYGRSGPLGAPQHRLADVDLEQRTATCSLCGPSTPVLVSRRRGTGERYARMCLSRYPAVQKRGREWAAATSYALTDDERSALLERQGGVCANPTCGKPDSDASRWTRLWTDHDHASPSDDVRGLLCRLCNASIGMAPGDNLTGVLGLAVYLAEYERPALVDELRRLLGHLSPADSRTSMVGDGMTA